MVPTGEHELSDMTRNTILAHIDVFGVCLEVDFFKYLAQRNMMNVL